MKLRLGWSWIKRGGMFWPSAGLLAVTIGMVWWWPGPRAGCLAPDVGLRVWGTMLQLLGVWTVWADLAGAARHFGKEGILRRTLQWVAEPFRRSRTSLNLHGVSAATATGTITATISRSPLRGLGIEERLGVIEFNIDQLRKELADANKSIDAARAALVAQLQAADAALRKEVNEVRGSLKETATGNYSTLVFGAAWLAIGLLVATMSPELLRLSADGRARVIDQGAAIAAGSCQP